ncbi:MAG: phosphorylase, partial [Pedobacter sp.]
TLNIIRIGTSGAIQTDIPMGTILASSHGLGLDALMNYYQQDMNPETDEMLGAFNNHINNIPGIHPYLTAASENLISKIAFDMQKGITVTAPGFYAPQGREVRAVRTVPNLIAALSGFSYRNYRITNLEMETAGIYALAKALGHNALSINAILASRVNYTFASNPAAIVDSAIKTVLERLNSI